MPKVLFVAFENREDARALAEQASRTLVDKGVETDILLLTEGGDIPLASTELVVSLGGDGTFLRAARVAHFSHAKVLPVNLGRLGFLLNVPPDNLVEEILNATTTNIVEKRLVLNVYVPHMNQSFFAMNEVVVEREHVGHMVRVKTFVDGEEYLTYAADGVMVSTPTGSTGYNFSVGGPVVHTSLSVMLMTAIAPHFTIDRAIVVGSSSKIEFSVVDKPALIVVDGETVGTIDAGESIVVTRAEEDVRVVANRSFDLSSRLRQGLREGHA